MKLTYNIDIDGRKIAQNGTIISDGIADAVNRLAYLEGWATNVQPLDLGDGAKVHIFAYTIEAVIDEQQLRDLVNACKMYGVPYTLSGSAQWSIKMTFGAVVVGMDAKRNNPAEIPNAETLLFA